MVGVVEVEVGIVGRRIPTGEPVEIRWEVEIDRRVSLEMPLETGYAEANLITQRGQAGGCVVGVMWEEWRVKGGRSSSGGM